MGELLQVGQGDAVSRMLQALAKDVGVREVWSGRGDTDGRRLLLRLYNAELVKHSLLQGIADLLSMPDWKEVPETIQAQAAAVVLRARACIDLASKTELSMSANSASALSGK